MQQLHGADITQASEEPAKRSAKGAMEKPMRVFEVTITDEMGELEVTICWSAEERDHVVRCAKDAGFGTRVKVVG